MEEFYEIRDMFVPFNLPISADELDVEQILSLTKRIKMHGGQIRFVLLDKIGHALLDDTVTEDEMEQQLKN